MSWDDAIEGVDRDTPGGRMPRAWNVAARLRAANDDISHAHVADGVPTYAELHCLSDFSFLRGASSAEQLFARAQHCGYSAWPSPTNARWPASCVAWKPRASPACD